VDRTLDGRSDPGDQGAVSERRDEDGALFAETLMSMRDEEAAGLPARPCLTILYHPDLSRIGQRVWTGEALAVSRVEPDFEGTPLSDPYLSRSPVTITSSWPAAQVAAAAGARVSAQGAPLSGKRTLEMEELRAGVQLELAKRVLLLLHNASDTGPSSDGDLVGESDGIASVRRAIAKVADLDVPVLIRGETGVGKERVAQAIHAASARRDRPCIAVNMAAIPPTIATTELFGHTRGAFTGAAGSHAGYFERADHGTLFLDEIGETPGGVQAMLLRALETGEIQPVGDERARKVDVRIVAATDADLDEAGARGAFRVALLHRLAGYEIVVPPLRERRDDIPRLVLHFLRQELEAVGEPHRLAPRGPKDTLWFPLSLMRRLCLYDWPGNVRQLRNVVRQLVISSRGSETVQVDALVERLLEGDEPSSPPPPESTGVGIDDDRLVEAMRANNWAPGPTAKSLGIPTSTLYDLIESCPRLRKAKDIPDEELSRCHAECGGDLDAMVERLEVSRRGIRLRLKALGLV